MYGRGNFVVRIRTYDRTIGKHLTKYHCLKGWTRHAHKARLMYGYDAKRLVETMRPHMNATMIRIPINETKDWSQATEYVQHCMEEDSK